MSETPTPPPAPRRRRRFRTFIGGLVVVVAATLLALQVGPIRLLVVNAALTVFNPWPGTFLQAAGAGGRLPWSLEVRDLTLTRPDYSTALRVDSVRISWSLLPLVRRTVHLHDVAVAGIALEPVRDADGELDLLAPFLAGDSSAWSARIDRMRLDRGTLRIHQGDSVTWEAGELVLRATAIETGRAVAGRVDTLGGSLGAPGPLPRGRISVRASLGAQGVRLDTLVLATARSQARASGRLVYGHDTLPDSLAADLVAEPLALADFAGLLPSLREDGVIEGRLTAGRSGSVWSASGAFTVSAAGEPPARIELYGARDTVSTRLEGRLAVEDLRTALVVGTRPPTERVSLTAAARLEGAFPGGLNGTSQIDILEAQVAGVVVRGRLDQRWQAGRVDLDGRGALARGGATWTMGGGARWSATDSTWSLRGSVTDLDASDLAPDAGIDARGSFTVEASGAGYARLDAWDGRLTVHDASMGSCRIGPGTTTARLHDRRLDISLVIPACGGSITGRGTGDPEGNWTLADLSIRDIDAARALGDTTASRISGRFEGSGKGLDSWSLQAGLDSLRWGSARLDRLEASVVSQSGRVSLRSLARVDSGTVRAHGVLTADAVRVESLELHDLDVGGATGLAGLRTRLRARGTAEVSRLKGQGGRVTLDVGPSTVNGVPIEAGRLQATAPAADTLSIDAALAWIGGDLALVGHASRDTSGTWTVASEDARFRGLDVSAWADRDEWTTSFTGSVRVTARLADAGPSGTATLRLEAPSSVRGVALRQTDLDLDVRDGLARARIDAAFAEGGALRAAGSARNAPDGPWSVEIQADSVDFARLAGLDSTGSSLQLRAHGAGTGREGRVTIDAARAVWRDAVLSSAAALGEVSGGSLRIDSLGLAGSFGQLVVRGTVPIESRGEDADLRVNGLVENLGPWFARAGLPGMLTRNGRLDGSVTGTPDRLSANATVSLEGIALGPLHVASGRAIASAEWGSGLEAPAASVRLDARVLSLPGTAAEGLVIDARLAGDSLDVTGDVRFAETRSARLELHSDRSLTRASLRTLDLVLDSAAWSLATPVAVSREEGALEWTPLVLTSGDSRVVTGGRAGRDASDFFVSAAGVQLDAVADLAGFRGLGLSLDATLVASGPTDNLSVGGSIEARIASSGRPAAELSLQTRLEDGLLAASGLLRHTTGREARIEGTVAISGDAGTPGDVVLDVSADAVPIDWTLPFFDRELVDAVGGALTGSLAVRGTFQDPVLDGQAHLSGGRMGLPTLGRPGASLVFDAIEAELGFSGSTIQVRSASMRSGPGRLTATGTVELTELDLGAVALDLRSDDFLAIDDEEFRAFVASNLRLTGTTRRPVLGGQVRVTRGDFRLADRTSADAFEPVALDEEDLLTLERRFGLRVSAADTSTFVFYEALTIEDLRLDFDRDAWLRSARNPKMDVQFRGSLNVRKRPHTDPTVFGDISVLPENSRIEQFGRTFEIERGDLSFTGPAFEPDIDLVGSYRVPSRGTGGDEVTIRLVARGRPDDLRVTFESDPAMELADVVSYIATGRPASGSLHFDAAAGNSYLGTAAGLAVGPLSSFVEDVALAGLGLDVVEIENDGLRGLTLTVGKYVSPEFYVSVSQPIALASTAEAGTSGTERRTQVLMEYEIVRQLLVSLLNRGAVLRINLRWEYAF